ncbi:MAG: hypothetical protein ACI90V_013566, partial [Bacillariaceae sp.]
NNNNSERIEIERHYQEFLFDEESVVRSVGSRGGGEEEDDNEDDEDDDPTIDETNTNKRIMSSTGTAANVEFI